MPIRILDDVTISNGLAWSSDARTMYYVDTSTQQISSFDYDLESATIANRRTLVEIPEADGWPDGMTIDADDCLWVAFWGGSAVRRYMPDGRLDRVLTFPCAQITSCAFVGPALDRLVVTSALARARGAGAARRRDLRRRPRRHRHRDRSVRRLELPELLVGREWLHPAAYRVADEVLGADERLRLLSTVSIRSRGITATPSASPTM